MTLVPWKVGRPLVWDATCVDTLAPSHVASTAGCSGAAAAAAETLKRRKYFNLVGCYSFEPFGVETLGSWGPSARLLNKEISRRLVDTSRDYRGLPLSMAKELALPFNVAMLPVFWALSQMTAIRRSTLTPNLFCTFCVYRVTCNWTYSWQEV